MASLTRGISFRRQGSSGMSWTDTWSFNEEGVLVRNTKEEAAALQQQQQLCGQRFSGSSLSRIHDLHFLDEGEAVSAEQTSTSQPVAECPPSPARLLRSKSAGNVPARPIPPPAAPRKSGRGFLRWLKKAFSKRKVR